MIHIDSYEILVAAAKVVEWPEHTPKVYPSGSEEFEYGAVFYKNYVEAFDLRDGASTMMSKRKFLSLK